MMSGNTPSAGNPNPGEPKTLMQLLNAKYQEKHGPAAPEDADADEAVRGFVEFCEEYLAKNKVTSVWYPPSGLGLMFSNHERVRISSPQPAVAKPSANVPVTPPATAGMNVFEGPGGGIKRDTSVGITGRE